MPISWPEPSAGDRIPLRFLGDYETLAKEPVSSGGAALPGLNAHRRRTAGKGNQRRSRPQIMSPVANATAKLTKGRSSTLPAMLRTC
jgi:hypothetical protein